MCTPPNALFAGERGRVRCGQRVRKPVRRRSLYVFIQTCGSLCGNLYVKNARALRNKRPARNACRLLLVPLSMCFPPSCFSRLICDHHGTSKLILFSSCFGCCCCSCCMRRACGRAVVDLLRDLQKRHEHALRHPVG